MLQHEEGCATVSIILESGQCQIEEFRGVFCVELLILGVIRVWTKFVVVAFLTSGRVACALVVG
jgi:hypothetical protein